MQDDYGNALLGAKTINERLQALSEDMRAHLSRGEQRMSNIEANVDTLRADVASNTAATRAVAENTRELVELFESFKGAIRVLNWLGRLAKPMAYIVGLGTACVGFWVALKGK